MGLTSLLVELLDEDDRRREGAIKRKLWVRSIVAKRDEKGEHVLVSEMREDPEIFFGYFRMYPETFDKLHSLVGPLIRKEYTNCRAPLRTEDKLAAVLR